jgi:hypothetical protein
MVFQTNHWQNSKNRRTGRRTKLKLERPVGKIPDRLNKYTTKTMKKRKPHAYIMKTADFSFIEPFLIICLILFFASP